MPVNVTLECWSEALLPALAECASDARIGTWLDDFFPHPYTEEDARRYYAAMRSMSGGLFRAVFEDGALAGCISALRGKGVGCRDLELGYWLNPAFWGRGVGSAAVRAMCALAFSQTDAVRIHADVFCANAASVRLLEKCGFSREGVFARAAFKNGVFHDVARYALLKERCASRE